MAQIPYNPVKHATVATEAEIAAMHRRLAEKLKPKVEVVQVEQQTSAGKDAVAAGVASAENTLRWEQPEEKSRELYTTCRRYRCYRTAYNEVTNDPPRYKYRVEFLVEGMWYYRLTGDLDSFKEARAAAQAHADKART